MRVLFRTVVAAAALLAGGSAFAGESYGPYLGGYGVFVMPDSVDVDGDADGDGVKDDAKATFDNGWGVGAIAGYDYGAFRFEAEVGYRMFDGAKIKDLVLGASNGNPPVALGSFDLTSEFGLLTVMANVLYEFENDSRFTPYVGVGLGAGWMFIDTPNSGSAGSLGIADGEDVGFAYQGIAGAKVAITDELAGFIDYRYLGTADIQVNEFKTSYATHNVVAGLTYTFTPYDPPAPPVPQPGTAEVPAQASSRSFMVFFDWNSSAITAEATAIIQDAAQSAMTLGTSRIELTGHADRSGSTGYNQSLSLRRAEAVKAQLVSLGLDPSEIATVGKGESAPLVPTPDGVREPQNRRVEIVLP